MRRGIYSKSSGFSREELFKRAVAALVREWNVTEEQARDALVRNMIQEEAS